MVGIFDYYINLIFTNENINDKDNSYPNSLVIKVLIAME